MRRIILLLLILLAIPSVYSLGISPASARIPYSVGAEYNFEIQVTSQSPMKFNLSAKGSFPEAFSFSNNEFYLSETYMKIPIKLVQPEFDEPGPKTTYLCANQIPPKEYGRRTIGAVVSVCSTIILEVPYPDKYVSFSMKTENVNQGETVYFEIEAANKGEKNVNLLSGNIEMYEKETNKFIDSVSLTEIQNLETSKREKMYAEWSTQNQNPGKYLAVAKINYDEKSAEKQAEFRVGTHEVVLKSINSTVVAGAIRPFDIEIENLWNEKVENVYADVIIYNNQSQEIQSFQTTSKNLGPFEISKLKGYIDATNFAPQKYNIKIKLNFEGKYNEYDENIFVIEKQSSANMIVGISVIIISAIIILLGIFLLYKKYSK